MWLRKPHQPSLARVAVVLFAPRFALRFRLTDHDCHRKTPNVKGNSHCTSPPFGRMGIPQPQSAQLLRRLLVSVDLSTNDISATGGHLCFVRLRVCCSLSAPFGTILLYINCRKLSIVFLNNFVKVYLRHRYHDLFHRWRCARPGRCRFFLARRKAEQE